MHMYMQKHRHVHECASYTARSGAGTRWTTWAGSMGRTRRSGGGRRARPGCRAAGGTRRQEPAAARREVLWHARLRPSESWLPEQPPADFMGARFCSTWLPPPPARLCCSLRVGSTSVLHRCQGLLPVAARAFGLSNRINRINRMNQSASLLA